ncbi:hypothetical protein EKH57_05250 [Halorubrum sp. BOL3-1]|nr:hypothetical protein EKH57_05250 [Halorubrum sp. BOL3-1]
MCSGISIHTFLYWYRYRWHGRSIRRLILIDRPGRDFAMAMDDLAEAVHQYLVDFADAHSRCSCDS